MDRLLFVGFPFEFLIYLFLIGVAVTLHIFYSGRMFGWLVSRLLQWSFGSHYFVRIGSINFALIAGRIIFREVVYSTQNTVARVVDGSITLRCERFVCWSLILSLLDISLLQRDCNKTVC